MIGLINGATMTLNNEDFFKTSHKASMRLVEGYKKEKQKHFALVHYIRHKYIKKPICCMLDEVSVYDWFDKWEKKTKP